ncbi:MAG TPA: hypothetical protein PLG05_10225 [Bacteroidales bacterium]|jgi:hypothetical protein|nr:hypothetical protein [Bacteroidales bacterium]HPL05538.1 hypothetical protein [Bacteroidales bacterium]
MIYIDNIKKSEATLNKQYPNAKYVDITSKATTGLVKLSPFYPHGDIPIPFSNGKTAKCVEGIWQGLKVFEYEDIDTSMFENATMKNIKRTVRKFGKPKGHRKGVYGKEFLDYIEARIYIYLPSYLWVLENKVQTIIERLKIASKEQDIVLLDYATNCDVLDPRKPLSHAYLVKAYVEGNYPTPEKLQEKLQEIKTSGVNPYQFTEQKKEPKKLSEKDKMLLDKILDLIALKPLSSNEILERLKIDLKPNTLTRMLKKSKEVQTIQGKPLRFKRNNINQQSLFD